MVQTEQQYICIHQCLLAVLEGQDTAGPPREIHDNQGFEGMPRVSIASDQSTNQVTNISDLIGRDNLNDQY